jgi:uncharacterized protein (TIGR03067 family)
MTTNQNARPAARLVISNLRTSCILVVSLFVLPSFGYADDREALIGTWKITVYQDDGNDRLSRLGAGPAKKGKEPRVAKLVFTADECYLIRGDGRREMANGLTNAGWKSITLAPSTTPKSIEIIGFAGKGNEKSKTYPGIYEIDADRLRICYAETSPKRPTKFESNGHNNLFECERISKEPIPVPQN